MIWWLIILGLLTLLILILIRTRLFIEIDVKHTRDHNHIQILFKAWKGLIKYRYEVPLVAVDDESASVVIKEEKAAGPTGDNEKESKKKITPQDVINRIKQAKKLLEHVVGFHRIVRLFLSHITIHKIMWKTAIGVGDAAKTGTLTGIIWTLKGSIMGIISQYMRLSKQPIIEVYPHFQQTITHTELTCIVSFRIGHAMGAALRLVKFWRGIRKTKSVPDSFNKRKTM